MLEIPDLTGFPPGHPPSPYKFPIGYFLPPDQQLFAIGWLERTIPTKDDTPSRCISRLIEAFGTGLYFNDLTLGVHKCGFCSDEPCLQISGHPSPNVVWNSKKLWIKGYGHFLVRKLEKIYMAPILIIHYIVAHAYRPPDLFLDAVSNGKFLHRSDLPRDNNSAPSLFL